MTRIARRTFIKTAAAGIMGPRVVMAQSPDFVVVGAGAFGAWTALHLRELGHRVALVDAYGPGNSRASSGGETRQIRVGYGDQELYSRWVLKAFDLWRAREEEFGQRLLFETGRLQLAAEWSDSLKATQRVLEKLGVGCEVVSTEELEKRYPQMRPEGVSFALFEPSAAVLRARFALQRVAEAFQKKGGQLILGRVEPPRVSGARLESIRLTNATSLSAATYVFACGPWLPQMFPETMKGKLFVPRRDVFFFGTPPGDDRFSYPNLPNYSESAYYGFPSIDGRGFKVCPVGEMTPFDPDRDERVPSAYQLQRARAYLAERFPALANQPLVESRVCQLEMSVDEHFIIQKHPSWSNAWIAGGGSGHGFKHGPVLGDYIARRASGADPEPELESIFRIKSSSFDPSVYESGARKH
ncbi:MAG TPA: FAD-dependent oxidoreductase [Vicinamibacteria bacterium]|nr:FAD-dependent oxidoreductase [Vicinamibacteria bacterium]